MTADNQTSLRFSLKESIWFQKGQEVAELISISLDPDIVIQERDYEVVVRGELQLTGEYIAQPDEAAFSLRELSPVRTVDAVYTREDGVNEISHSFPLEISIPRSRMKQVDDLYLTIESFDYEMPENGCLQLIADISIGGLCEPEEAREEAEETEEYYDIPIFLQEEARKEEKETEEIEEYYDVPAFLQKEARKEEKETKETEEIEEYYDVPAFLQKEARKEEKETKETEEIEEYYDVPAFLQKEVRKEEKETKETEEIEEYYDVPAFLKKEARKEEKETEEIEEYYDVPAFLQKEARKEEKETETETEEIEEYYDVPAFLQKEARKEEKETETEEIEEYYDVPAFLQKEARKEEKETEEIEEYYDVPIFMQAEAKEREDDIFEPFQLEVRKQPVEEQQPQKAAFSPQVELFGRAQAVLNETDAQEDSGYSQRDENALYLTKLFTKERDEEFTKMRMYFVQQGDTVDSIAERYDITVQHLTRINGLDDLYVQEGKILYIPVAKPRAKS